jgi:hypothetical protein
MRKLLIGIFTMVSISANAQILPSLADAIELKSCKSQLMKQLKKSDATIKYDLRYLNSIQTFPALHLFAVYEDQTAEPIEVIKMVKHPGQKCTRY